VVRPRLRCLDALALTLVWALAVGGCGGGGESRLEDVSAGPDCGPSWSEPTVVGTLPGDLKEVSGFVASPNRADVAWMIRDSGNPATLYSFEVDGDGEISTREFPVAGATNGDWEDVAATTGDDGRVRLWILDNINRHTAPKTIWEVLQPDPGDDHAELVGLYRWRYPDGNGNHDTETLFVSDGHFVVASKTEPSRAYRFDAPLSSTRVNEPVLVGDVPGPKLVFGSTSGDGRRLVTSSTKTDAVYVADLGDARRAGGADPLDGWVGQPPRFERAMSAAQREAGDFFPHQGCDIVLLDEREHVWLLRNQNSTR
jgi:hypothetical protein